MVLYILQFTYIFLRKLISPINLCSFEKVPRVILIFKNVVFMNVLQFYKLFTLYLFIEIFNNDIQNQFFYDTKRMYTNSIGDFVSKIMLIYNTN